MKKKNIPTVILIVVFAVGLCVFLYPTVSNLLSRFRQTRVIEDYDAAVAALDTTDMDRMLDEARAYNEQYAKNAFSYREDVENGTELYRNTLNIRNGVMGRLKIDKLDVNLPIYHGTSASVLQSGIGHLPMTSLPVGGEGTHAVLSGHRGLPSAELLSKLDRMENGDIFYIYILNEVLAYEVKEIRTVLPSELDSLSIDPHADKVSLVTCTPYGINTHRLIVTGYRIPYEDTIVEQYRAGADALLISPRAVAFYVGVPVFLLVILIILLRYRRKSKKRKGVKSDENTE